MSKSLLEELLIQAGTLNEETEKRVNTNQKTIIESTMANAVKNFIQEAVEDSEEGIESMGTEEINEIQKDIYEEEDVDVETGETLEDEDEDLDVEIEDDEEEYDEEEEEEDEEIEIVDDEDEDYEEEEEDYGDDEEIEIVDDEDEDYSMDDEESFGDDEHMSSTTDFEDDEEVTDMTNASLEEVMDFIENSEDEVVVKIVKKPTYSVSVENMSDDTEIEVNEDMLAEIISQELEEEEQMTVITPAEFDSKKYKGKTLGMKDPKTGDVSIVQAENRKLKKQLAQLKEETRKLKLNETKSVAALKSMMEQSKKLALVNSNLAYVSRLFTEHVTTKQEKVEILKAFDSAKTITESQKRFKVLNESLSTRTQKKKINVNINESVDFNQQKVIKEEKAFVEDPAQANILRLMNYKSQL